MCFAGFAGFGYFVYVCLSYFIVVLLFATIDVLFVVIVWFRLVLVDVS